MQLAPFDKELAADQELHRVLLGRHVCAHNTGNAALVRNGKRRVPQSLGALH